MDKAGFTNNSAITISNQISIFIAEEDEQYYTILSDLLFEYGCVFDFDNTSSFIILQLFNYPIATPTQVFNRNNIRESLTQKIEEQKSSNNITLNWSTLTFFKKTTIYENIQGRNATYPDGCELNVAPNTYLFLNKENILNYDSSLGDVVWVDEIYKEIRAPFPLDIEKCENLGKSCILSIKNTGSLAAFVTKLKIVGDAYIQVEGQKTRSPGNGEEKKYELKYNHNAADIDILAKKLAAYYEFSNLKVSLQSEDNYHIGSFVVVVESYMGTIIGRIIKKTTVLRDFFKYEIESISEYDQEEKNETLMKPSGKMKSLLAIPPDITPPSIPNITNINTLSSGKIQIKFTSSTDNESGVYFYNIYRCQSDTETGTKDTPVVIYTIPHDGSINYIFVDNGTENKKWYFYVITAVDKANNESSNSIEQGVKAVVTASPKSPYLIKAEAISDGVSINLFLYGDTSIFENTITSSTFFRLQVSLNGGMSWTDVGKLQGNSYLWRWPDTFVINPTNVNNLKFRAFSWNIYNIESTIPIDMMNHRIRFDASLMPPPYQPTNNLFTEIAASQVTAGTKKVTIPKGWYKIIIKAAGGGGGEHKGYVLWETIGDNGDSGGSGENGGDGGDSLIIIKKIILQLLQKAELGV